MSSDSKVLVYHHRHDATNPIVPDGLAIFTKGEVEDILQKRNTSLSPPAPKPKAPLTHVHRRPSATQHQAHHPRLSPRRNIRARSSDRGAEATVGWHAKLRDERGWCYRAVEGVLGQAGWVEGF